MIRRPPRSTRKESSAASDVYKRQDTDSAQIEAVDELLQTAMERDKMAILAASILELGRKVWLYVSRTYDPFFDRLEEVLAELPLLPLQFEVVQDSDWSYYQELLDKLQP